MRISDWSSDVCSSDIGMHWNDGLTSFAVEDRCALPILRCFPESVIAEDRRGRRRPQPVHERGSLRVRARLHLRHRIHDRRVRARSEEHTSELQSLMRISYAVFYLQYKQRLPTK